MKKILSVIFIIAIISGTIPAMAADSLKLWDVAFCTADNERIFKAESGNIYSAAEFFNSGAASDIYIMTSAYDNSGSITDVKVLSTTVPEGYSILDSKAVTSSNASRIKTLILNKNFSPVAAYNKFVNEIKNVLIKSFSMTINGKTYIGLINNKTDEIIVDIPVYTIGEGESDLSKPNLSSATINAVGNGISVEAIDNDFDFENGVRYAASDENGNTHYYNVFVKYSVRQYSTDFEDGIINGVVSGANGSGNLTASNVSVATDNTNTALTFSKSTTDNTYSFNVTEGCYPHFVTDCKMEFDFKINSISSENEAAAWYMGEMHRIVPVKTTNGYTLKYKCGETGPLSEIMGIGELSFGETYTLTYTYSNKNYMGELYINHSYVGTLKNIENKIPSSKLTPTISLTTYKKSLISASFDNIEVTYREDTNNDKINLHLLGDSIMHTYVPKGNFGQEGWGAYIGDFLGDTVNVINHAIPGNSTGMTFFGGEPKRHDMPSVWPLLKDNLYEGDYVMISFGWNEGVENVNNSYPCGTTDEFKANLSKMIEYASAAGAKVILVTPTFSCTGTSFDNRNTKWSDAMKELAKTKSDVVCLDLNTALMTAFTKIGPAAVLDKFHPISMSTGTTKDTTHYNEAGAYLIAEMVIDLLKESNSTLKNHLLESVETNEDTRQFTITDASGKYTYGGYIDEETKTIYVEQVVDIYSGNNGYPKYYNLRANEYVSLQNATYKTTIGGNEHTGSINLTPETAADITIGSENYKVVLERYVAGVVANFDARSNLFRGDIDDEENKNLITINQWQHNPRYGGTRYGSDKSAGISAKSLLSYRNITEMQSTLSIPHFNLSYAENAGRDGKYDTALKVIKKGNTSDYAPAIHLYDNGSYWGKNGKMDISFDMKYTHFNGEGSIAEIQLLDGKGDKPNPVAYLSMPKAGNDEAYICYVSTDTGAVGFDGWSKKIATIKKNEWNNIRIIYDRDNSTFIICVNDSVVLKTPYKYSASSVIPTEFRTNILRFGTYSTTECTYYLDNIEMKCSMVSQ